MQAPSPPPVPLFHSPAPEDLLASCTAFLRGELVALLAEQAALGTGAPVARVCCVWAAMPCVDVGGCGWLWAVMAYVDVGGWG